MNEIGDRKIAKMMSPKSPKQKQEFDLNLAIIVGGLGLLGLIFLVYGIVSVWNNGGNAEEELCKAFPAKCPADSPYRVMPNQ